MRIASLLLMIAAAAGAGWLFFFGGAHITAWKMQDVVGSAALSWNSLGETRGRQQLEEEMRRREIPAYLTKEQCTFYEEAGGAKTVECSWFVDVHMPLVGGRRVRFRVAKRADASGTLTDA